MIRLLMYLTYLDDFFAFENKLGTVMDDICTVRHYMDEIHRSQTPDVF